MSEGERESFFRDVQPYRVIRGLLDSDLRQVSTLLSSAPAQEESDSAHEAFLKKMWDLFQQIGGTLLELTLAEDLNRENVESILSSCLHRLNVTNDQVDMVMVKSHILSQYDWLIHQKAKGRAVRSKPLFLSEDEPAYTFHANRVLDMRAYISSRLQDVREEDEGE